MFKIIFGLSLSLSLYAATMQEMVSYLASDQLEGRKPGQAGNELAQNYIVSQFLQLGIDPLGDQYKQEFTIFTEMQKLPGKNWLRFQNKDLSFEPLSLSVSKSLIEKPLVFVGFGISIPANDPKMKYDDYKNIDVKNKVVVVMTGDPGIGNTQSPFRDPDYINYRSLFYKLNNAIAHGAAGFILVQDPLSLSGTEGPLNFNSTEGGGSRFSLVAGQTTVEEINKLLPNIKLKEIQKKIAKFQRSFSSDLNKHISMEIGLKKLTGRVANINAVIPGSKKGVIVLGAHMDHLGWGGESSADPDPTPKIHNGADDNASGTAMVIKLAENLKNLKLKKTIVLSLFNAEEMGLLGSDHFVKAWGQHESKYGKIEGMLNFDMVGRYNQQVSVMGTDSAGQWNQFLNGISAGRIFTLKKEAVSASDHASFIQSKIPALFFTTGAHEDYHRSTDDSDKIDYASMQALHTFSLSLIENIDLGPRLTFNPSYNPGGDSGGRGYGASLGCIPKFGQSDQIKGVVCTGTTPNSAAAAAGILAGDIIIQIGEIEINSVYDLAFALKYYRAGDNVLIRWKRASDVYSKSVTLKKSSRGK